MPLYDVRCSACGDEFELASTVSGLEAALHCRCGGSLAVVIRPVPTVGPMPSKPLDLRKQLGRSFDSVTDLKRWQKENPKLTMVDPGDGGYRRMRDDSRAKCEAAARRAGYTDLEERRKADRARVAAEAAPARRISVGDK